MYKNIACLQFLESGKAYTGVMNMRQVWDSFFLILLLDIFYLHLLHITNVTPSPSFPSISPLSHSPSFFLWGCSPPQSSPPSCLLLTFPYTGGGWVQLWQDQGLLFPLVPNKIILCYICSWSHGSLHESLGSGLVPGSFGWLVLLFLWGCKPLQLL